MNNRIHIVTDEHQLIVLVALATEIRQQYFMPIIGQTQIDDILDRFQSAEAMESQMASGYE